MRNQTTRWVAKLDKDEKGVRKVYPIDGTPVQQLMWLESILALLDEKQTPMN